MRRIQTLFTAALLTLGAATVVEAQQPQGAPQGGQRGGGRGMGNPTAQIDRLVDSIALSPAQTAKLDSIKALYAPKMQALRQEMMDARQNGGDMTAFRTKNQELQAKIEADIRAVLTAEQIPVLDKNKAAAAERMQRGGQGGGQRPPRS